MFGINLFCNICNNLSDDCRNRLLGNIFEVMNVVVSNVIIHEDFVVIKLFSNGIFYKYVFLLQSGKTVFTNDERIIRCKIFVFNEKQEMFRNFINHVILCCDEYQIYCWLKNFL